MIKEGKLFKRIFFPLSILATFIVMLTISIIGFVAYRGSNDLLGQVKANEIKQVQTNFELNLQNFEYAFSGYSTTTSFYELIELPLKNKDFQVVNEINSQLNYIGTKVLEGSKFSLLSLKQNWIIRSDSLFQVDDEYVESVQEEYLNDAKDGLYWVKDDNNLRFVMSLPISSPIRSAVVFADISQNSLDQLIHTGSNAEIFVLNNKMELMYNSPNMNQKIEDLGLNDIRSEYLASKMHPEKFLDTKTKLVCTTSQYNDWSYCSVKQPSEVFRLVLPALILSSIFGFSFLAFLIFYAYRFSYRYTEPILSMSKMISPNLDANVNELEHLSASISNMIDEQEILKNTLEEEIPQLEAQFILNLYRNKIFQHEINEKMMQFGYKDYDPELSSFATLLVQIDDMGEHRDAEKDLMLVVIQRIVHETIPKQFRMRPIILNDTTQATVLMFEGRDKEKNRALINKFAEDVVKNAKEVVRVSVSVGVGNQFNSLINMRESSEMAKQALRHRILVGKEAVIFYEDISSILSGEVVSNYPQDRELEIMDAISVGDQALANELLHTMFISIMQSNNDFGVVQMLMIRLVNRLIEYQTQHGLVKELHETNIKVYKEILDTYNPSSIESIIANQIVSPMALFIQEKTESQFRGLSEQVIEILKDRYLEDISLETIAEDLHYNPNYLSRVFKREMGMNFSNYLIHYRIEVAKEMLSDTDKTIKEIAEELQYSNSQNFIRTFRKITGVTPGAYRKDQNYE